MYIVSMKPIKIYDSEGQELASFTLKDRDKAFEYAEQMEAMGIEVSIKEPSLPETLILSLGANRSDTEQLQKEIDEEIDSHGNNCCSEHLLQ